MSEKMSPTSKDPLYSASTLLKGYCSCHAYTPPCHMNRAAEHAGQSVGMVCSKHAASIVLAGYDCGHGGIPDGQHYLAAGAVDGDVMARPADPIGPLRHEDVGAADAGQHAHRLVVGFHRRATRSVEAARGAVQNEECRRGHTTSFEVCEHGIPSHFLPAPT